jgi:predicted transposase YbfD/YdcC
MLEIAESVITIDAMGCQKDITSLIAKKKVDYILALKGTKKLLYKAVKDWFEVAKKEDYLGREYNYYEQVEAGHHRVEKRQVWTVDVS